MQFPEGGQTPEAISKTARLQQRVAELVQDDEDDNISTQSPLSFLSTRGAWPGASGMATMSTSDGVLQEMDGVLSSLKQWQEKQQKDMADMLAKNKSRLDEAYQPAAASIPDQAELDALTAAEASAADFNSASPPAPSLRDMRVTSASRRLAAAAAAASTIASENIECGRGRQPDAAAGLGSNGHHVTGIQHTGQPAAATAAGKGLERPVSARLRVPQLSQQEVGVLLADHAQPRPSSAAKSAAVSSTSAACEAALQQGQQMLNALEEELRALDAEAEAQSSVTAWYADVEGALAKLDALQTGYQAELKDK